MFERAAMSWRRRASANESEPAVQPRAAGGTDPREGLTRAQARAMTRCAPLTPAEFKARRRVADQGVASLSGVLAERKDSRSR